jgi:hypothetical protein
MSCVQKATVGAQNCSFQISKKCRSNEQVQDSSRASHSFAQHLHKITFRSEIIATIQEYPCD